MIRRDSHPLSGKDIPQDFTFPGQEEQTDPGTGEIEALHEIETHYEKLLDQQTDRLVRDTIVKRLRAGAKPEEITDALKKFPVEDRQRIRERVKKIHGETLRDHSYFVHENDILKTEKTNLLKANQRLKEQTETNPLTSLANREAAGHIFEKIRREKENANESGSIVVVRMDLDGFKRINDKLGHAAGDTALVEVANKLKIVLSSLRPTDVPIHFSGDEFGLILTDVTPGENKDGSKKTLEETVENILKRVVGAIEEIDLPDGAKLTASAGFKIVEEEDDSGFAFFDGASDEAARFSKETKYVAGMESGRERVVNIDEPRRKFLERKGISSDQLNESRLRARFERLINDEFPEEIPEVVKTAIEGVVKIILSIKKMLKRPTNQ
ncbi:MAG: GGDEF domain-containing protein [Candidatus Magasanikbacteria bacterium]|nr:GGDEF domain-containing protein [Candidatus Magasanikbacteria bacterium]